MNSTRSDPRIPADHALLEAALSYGARGWRVIPIHDVSLGSCSCEKGPSCGISAGKHPRLDAWTTQGTIDPAQLAAWWQTWPQANVGLVTGAVSRLAVLDIDPRNGGDIALEDFLHHHGPLPDTPMVLTPSGGQHYYFACPHDLPGCHPAPGIDLQIAGQQVLAPPSITTRAYSWEASADPDEIPLASLPPWLFDIARAKARATAGGVDLPEALPIVTIQALQVSARIKYLIQTGEDPERVARYPSRSEAGFAVIQALLHAGHDHGTIAAVLMDPRFGISQYVWERKNPKSAFYQEQTRAWVAKEIARALAKPRPETRGAPDMTAPPAPDTHEPWPEVSAGHPIITSMDEVTGRPVEWLWYPYLALGKLCLLDGDPGVGKTLLAIQLAASLSKGFPLPDQLGKPTLPCGGPGITLFIATEDGLEDTLKPRLERAGADCSKVKVFNEFVDPHGQTHTFTLQHIDMLEQCLDQLHPRLVIIDAIQAVLGEKVDTNRANQVKKLLDPLAKLAASSQCAIIAIRHPAKPGQSIAKLIHRGGGSMAFIGTARLGLFAEDHPTDPTKVLLVQSKSNAGDLGRTQIFSKQRGLFEWCGVSRITKELLAGSGRGPDPHAFLEAYFWLEKRMEGQGAIAAEDILADAEKADIGKKPLYGAKKALAVISEQIRECWLWTLPAFPPPLYSTPLSGVSGGTGVTGLTGVSDSVSGEDGSHLADTPDILETPEIPDTPVSPVVTRSCACDPIYGEPQDDGSQLCLKCLMRAQGV